MFYGLFPHLEDHWYFLGVVVLYVILRPLFDFLAELIVFSTLKIFYLVRGNLTDGE